MLDDTCDDRPVGRPGQPVIDYQSPADGGERPPPIARWVQFLIGFLAMPAILGGTPVLIMAFSGKDPAVFRTWIVAVVAALALVIWLGHRPGWRWVGIGFLAFGLIVLAAVGVLACVTVLAR